MKYFIIECTIKNADLIDENKMKEHMAYTQKSMDKGLILMSGIIILINHLMNGLTNI